MDDQAELFYSDQPSLLYGDPSFDGHGDFYPDWTLRLFRRRAYAWRGANPHGRIEVGAPAARLPGVLEHYSYRDVADHLDRVQRWSSQAAHAMHAAGRRARWFDLVLRPLWRSGAPPCPVRPHRRPP